MARDQVITEIAQTVNELFGQGKTDPSADEIAKAHFPDKALPPEVVESIRKRLNRVREILETIHDKPVYLLSNAYYAGFRNKPPVNNAEARRCIPGIGPGARFAGIRLHTTGDDDLIYQAMLDMNYSSGAGKVKRQSNRVLTAVEEHRLSEPHAANIMRRGVKQAEPDNAVLADKVLANKPKALPAKKGR
jgi:hypothetical protein